MRVVVTGATSMIGVALIKECIKNNCEVLAIVRKDTSKLDRLPDSELLEVQYADLEKLKDVECNEKKYDVFYHFAWAFTSRESRDCPLLQAKNIEATLEAVQLARKLGCTRFICAGSQAEYGRVDGIIDADTIEKPLTSYGISKFSAGLLSKKMCEQLGIKHVWTRIFSVYGTNDTPNSMISYALRQFMRGETAAFSSAVQMWNFLFEDEAGKMFYLLGSKEVEEGIYCIADAKSMPLKTYIRKMADTFGEGAHCEFSSSNVKMPGLNVNIDKTVNMIGYIPQTKFEDGIRKIIECKKKGNMSNE